MATQSVSPIRSGTKATPEAVFQACEHLRETQGEFRNEDVVAITGGGLGTVGRLVTIFRKHEKITAANDALDAEVTITLVQSLDKLLSSQIQRSKSAVEEFLQGGGVELAALSDTVEEQSIKLKERDATIAELRQQLRDSEKSNAQLQTTVDEKTRTLAERDSQLTIKSNEVDHLYKEHASRVEQLNSSHQHQLTMALERQRKAIQSESGKQLVALAEKHTDDLALVERKYLDQLTEKDQRIEQLDTTVADLIEATHVLKSQLQKSELTAENQNTRYTARTEDLTALVESKQTALDEAQKTSQSLVDQIGEQLDSTSANISTQLSAVNDVTAQMTQALFDIDARLNEMKDE